MPGTLRKRLVWLLTESGRYEVDIEAGIVYSLWRGRRTAIKPEEHGAGGKRLDKIRLKYSGGRIRISLGRAVWIASRKRLVPRGFEIHHRDEDNSNHHWKNLRCLFSLDHDLEHEAQEIPF